MREFIDQVVRGQPLSAKVADRAVETLFSDTQSPESVSAFLGALRVRGETSIELLSLANKLRTECIRTPIEREDLLDTCGTGGDGSGTFNISTASSLILAGCGVKVAKHGNRSASSRCGSADVLEALSLKVDHSPEKTARSIELYSFGFQFAPHYHPLLKRVSSIRRSIGSPTLFNLVGPLVNPARVRFQVLGVYDERMLKSLAEVLLSLGTEEALLVHGDSGLDEISLSGATQVCHVRKGLIQSYSIHPEDFGVARSPLETIQGGDAKMNAGIIESILNGEERGPKRDVALMNASAGLLIMGLVRTWREGVDLARSTIESGKAYAVLNQLRRYI